MKSYAIVGASRGIGLEYVRQLADRPDTIVFAIVRNARSSTHLTAAAAGLKNVHIVEADVTDYNTVERAAKRVSEIAGGKLDCLIHNAARMDVDSIYKGFDDFDNMDALDEDFISAYKVNVLGTIHSIVAFLPLLRASEALSKKIVVISTGGADQKTVRTLGMANMAAYGATKAAQLIATTKWALKLKDDDFIVVSIRPGVVDTSSTMGEHGNPAAHADLQRVAAAMRASGRSVTVQTPAESVADQLKVIDRLVPEDNGAFLSHQGGEWTGALS